jgi:hypothetical protein
VLVDLDKVPPGDLPPPEAKRDLDDDEVLAIVKGAKASEWIEREVTSHFDKEIIRRQFGLMEKLIDTRLIG